MLLPEDGGGGVRRKEAAREARRLPVKLQVSSRTLTRICVRIRLAGMAAKPTLDGMRNALNAEMGSAGNGRLRVTPKQGRHV